MQTLPNETYAQMLKDATPPTKWYVTVPKAFLAGGVICALGEAFIHMYTQMGISKETAFPAASITLVFLAALLTGLNVYDNLASFGGAGMLVPITGFANAVASPALEFKTEGYILGVGAKMFTIAGPVIVYGTVAGIVYGLVLYLFKLY